MQPDASNVIIYVYRLASIPPMEFQSLLINGPLLGHALESIVSDDMALAGLMTDAARQKDLSGNDAAAKGARGDPKHVVG